MHIMAMITYPVRLHEHLAYSKARLLEVADPCYREDGDGKHFIYDHLHVGSYEQYHGEVTIHMSGKYLQRYYPFDQIILSASPTKGINRVP